MKPCDDLDGASRRDNAENLELRKRKKNKMRPCNDLDGASGRYNRENLELWKRKDEASRTEKCGTMHNSGKKKLDHLGETIIRIMLCISLTNLN